VEKMQATNVSQPAVPPRTISMVPPSRTDASEQSCSEFCLEQGLLGEFQYRRTWIITVLPTTRRGRGTRAAEHEDEVSASFSADRTLVVTVSDPARENFLSHCALNHFGEQSERPGSTAAGATQSELALTCAKNAIKLDPSLTSAH
jgi:hypothetical protein